MNKEEKVYYSARQECLSPNAEQPLYRLTIDTTRPEVFKAAPDMLKALENMLRFVKAHKPYLEDDSFSEYHRVIATMEAAINKAKGNDYSIR